MSTNKIEFILIVATFAAVALGTWALYLKLGRGGTNLAKLGRAALLVISAGSFAAGTQVSTTIEATGDELGFDRFAYEATNLIGNSHYIADPATPFDASHVAINRIVQ